jgi:hypothetical protein
VFPGDGNGALGAAIYALGTADNDSVAIADFNLDGKPDLAVIDEKAHFAIGLGDGALGFAQNDLPDAKESSQLETADLNGNGFPDLVSPARHGVQVFYKVPGGTFSAGTQLAPLTLGTSAPSVAVADLDEDGKVDIVARHGGERCGRVPRRSRRISQRGDGPFGAAPSWPTWAGCFPST